MSSPTPSSTPGVAALFDALEDKDREGLERELSRDELANDLREATRVLERFCVAGEAMSFFTYMVPGDCRERVHEATTRASVNIAGL